MPRSSLLVGLDAGLSGAKGLLAGVVLGGVIFLATHDSSLSVEDRVALLIAPAVVGLVAGVGAHFYQHVRAIHQSGAPMGVFRARAPNVNDPAAQPFFHAVASGGSLPEVGNVA